MYLAGFRPRAASLTTNMPRSCNSCNAAFSVALDLQPNLNIRAGDAVISPNGVALDKEELAEARKVFDSIRFERPNRRH